MSRIVAYPARPAMPLGYNLAGGLDAAHLDQLKAGGATLARVQFAWNSVEDYATGNLTLTTANLGFLTDCAARGIKPLIVAGYGPPYVTVGNVVLTAAVPAGTPAGTPIAVNAYAFTIDYPKCFIGTVDTVTAKSAYYGSLITAATPTTITLAAATSVNLTAGQSLPVQRLRYAPPNADTDPVGIPAYIRYAAFLAAQIAAAGAEGYVEIWNEYTWAHDRWSELSSFYDAPPATTLTLKMKQILTLVQQLSQPLGVSFVNGVANKTGFAGITVQGISVPGAITHDAVHPYGNNPEQASWDYYAWGFSGNKKTAPVLGADNWWEVVIAADIGGNFRSLGFVNDLTPNAPLLMATECGTYSTDDSAQAKYLPRRVASLWGMGITPWIYCFDDGITTGDVRYSVAPISTPRASYYALQRLMAVIGRMANLGPVGGAAPSVVGWPTDTWPLMTATLLGDSGHATILLWQRTEHPTTWSSVPSPTAVAASISIPAGTVIAEAVNVRTGVAVTTTISGTVLSVPVTDDVVAVRVAPA